MSNQTGAAVGAIATSVNWERKGLNLQAIIEAANQGKLGEPLTDWLVAKGWEIKEQEAPLASIVKVDRSTKLVFPDWVEKIMYSEIQDVGPSEFDITQVERWLHDDQKTGWVNGKTIYEFHKANDMFKDDFGLRELFAIQSKGIKFFRKHFKGKVVYGWKSVVLDGSGDLSVPSLLERSDKVILRWDWIGLNFDSNDPPLRLASPQDSVTKIS